MAIELTDDGTLDTVLRCSDCGEEFRFNYASGHESADDDTCSHGKAPADGCEDCYDEWITDCISEIEEEHDCAIDCYCGDSGALLLTAPREALSDCSTPGQPADEAVAHWLTRVEWAADDATLRRSLQGCGAWDDLQTADIDVIKARILWIQACDWREETKGDR